MPKVTLWENTPATGPSAGYVQAHFLKIRLKELGMRGPEYEAKIVERLKEVYKLHKSKSLMSRASSLLGKKDRDPYLDLFDVINLTLQKRDLTINFNEKSWFRNDKFMQTIRFEAYAQMYERAGKKGSDYVLHSVGSNKAKQRADTDDQVTFPQNWTPSRPSTPSPGTTIKRGSSPGLSPAGARSRIRDQMAFSAVPIEGPLTENNREDDRMMRPDKIQFNPKTKQIFAALNYGRCPHGSSVYYGDSHFVLADRLKVNAIYYPNDTFFYKGKAEQARTEQFPYSHLAVALAYNRPMSDLIIKSCLDGIVQYDNVNDFLLLEAHLHGEVPFTGNIKKMVVCSPEDRTIDVVRNARTFAAKWGIELSFIGPPKFPPPPKWGDVGAMY